jgi:PAS domain S-box-containing protein
MSNASSPTRTSHAVEADLSSYLLDLEAALRERERELQQARQLARLGAWRWSVETGEVTWTKEVYFAFGLDPALPPPAFSEIQALHTPQCRALLSASVEKALQSGEPYEHEMELVLADGSRRWIVARGEVAARDADGRVTELCGTIQDITEWKRTELALRERERELQEAQRINRIGTWTTDVRARQIWWSPEVYRAFGADPAGPPLLSPELDRRFLNGGYERMLEGFERAQTSGEPYEIDAEIEALDGTRRWICARGEVSRRGAGNEILELRGTIQDVTDRKTIEIALRERERELLEAQRIARLGTFRWEKATGVVSWSEEVYRAFGVDPRLPVPRGEDIARLMTPESWQRISQATSEALQAGTPYFLDLELVDRNGAGRHWVTVRGEGFKGADGEVVDLRGTVQDVTDRKRVEEALREREWDLKEAQRIAGLGSWRLVMATNELTWSEQMYRLFEIDPAQPVRRGDQHEPLFAPGQWSQVLLAFQKLAAGGEGFSMECQLAVPKGAERWVMLLAEAVRGADGALLEIRGTMRDMTLQKQAEQALKNRERRFRELAESLPELVWVSEADGMISYINPSFEKYAGVALADVAGSDLFRIVHPEDRPRSESLWRQCIATGQPYAMEVRLQRHDGVYRSFLARAAATRNEQGGIERWVGTATDIHDQKLAEEAVRRTEKLAATGRLAASMAHEINNPLAAVTNSLYLALTDTTLGEPTRSYLTLAQQELARVAAVTTQTLRFHQQASAPAQVDLGDIMDTAHALFQARFRSRGITVTREYACRHRLYCRGDELRQVFANLLSNALDATPENGVVRIRIRPAKDPAGEPGIRVTVADSGHGIPKDLRRRMFEPFVSTKDETGTGLGLWVVQGIVQRHKGRISLRSRTANEPGGSCGTTFSLFFPMDGMRR